MSELPEGWVETTIGEVSEEISYGFTASASQTPNGPKFLRITDIQNGVVDWGTVPFCNVPPSQAFRFILKNGDLVFARTGATTGKSFLITSCPEAVFASYLIRVRPAKCVLPKLLGYFFQSFSYWQQITESISGSAQPNCNASKLSALKISIPPLNEQRRIVAKLEKLLSRVDAAQARLANIPRLLKRFRQSVLAAACSGKLTADWRVENQHAEPAHKLLRQINLERQNSSLKLRKKFSVAESEQPFDIPETWLFCLFDDIAAIKPNALKAGPFCSSLTKACYVHSGYKIYGQEQVIRGDASYGDYYINEEKFRELQSCEVEAGDILISLVGTIGKVLIIPHDYEKGIINPRLMKISLHQSILNSYIEKYLTSPLAKNILDQDSHGGTMEILNLGMLKSLPISLPPLAEQQEIVRRVEALFKTADPIEARYCAAKAQVDKLTQSILARAFRGELVTPETELARREGRDFEPAAVLLERVRRERSASAAAPKHKSTAKRTATRQPRA